MLPLEAIGRKMDASTASCKALCMISSPRDGALLKSWRWSHVGPQALKPLSGAMNETENRSQMQVVSYFSTSHVFSILIPMFRSQSCLSHCSVVSLGGHCMPLHRAGRNIHSLQDLLEGWQVFSFWQALLCFLPQSLQEKTLVCRPSPNTPA